VKMLFDNGGMEMRPSLVSFGRFESSRGKGLSGKRIMGWWSHYMSFSSSRKEGEMEIPSSGVARKAKGKYLVIKACQDVVRARKRIQNHPRKQCQNVITQIVGWENPNTIHNMDRTMGIPTHCHLR
jgi:hypothetical protein